MVPIKQTFLRLTTHCSGIFSQIPRMSAKRHVSSCPNKMSMQECTCCEKRRVPRCLKSFFWHRQDAITTSRHEEWSHWPHRRILNWPYPSYVLLYIWVDAKKRKHYGSGIFIYSFICSQASSWMISKLSFGVCFLITLVFRSFNLISNIVPCLAISAIVSTTSAHGFWAVSFYILSIKAPRGNSLF